MLALQHSYQPDLPSIQGSPLWEDHVVSILALPRVYARYTRLMVFQHDKVAIVMGVLVG